MKQEIVVIGAGKIGRGSLGLFFSRAGWKVSFFGHNPEKMAELAEQGYYETRTTSGVVSRVEGFEVLDCSTNDALVERLSEVNVAAIALYEGAFPEVADGIAKTVKARMAKNNTEPLNFMLCVNAPTAKEELEGYILPALSAEEQDFYHEHFGLCFTMVLSNGSMPLPDDNPWLVLVSDTPILEVDGDPWIGDRVEGVGNVSYTTNGQAKIYRKVFVGNMSHAMNAYIGSAHGMNFLDEGITEDEWAQANIARAKEEATFAVTSEFEFDEEDLAAWRKVEEERHGPTPRSQTQHDPFSRIGNSPEKKISYSNRYIWPARMCLKHGRLPYYLAMGAAYGLLYIVNGHGEAPVERPTTDAEVRALVERFCGLGDEDFVLRDLIVAQYCAIPEAGIIPAAK